MIFVIIQLVGFPLDFHMSVPVPHNKIASDCYRHPSRANMADILITWC